MLADVLAGESPADGDCPVATVVIPSGREGDRPVGSLGVNVSVGWNDIEGLLPGSSKDLGYPPSRTVLVRSAREASNSTGRSERANQEASKPVPRLKRIVGNSRVPNPSNRGEGQCRRRRNWVQAAAGLSGVLEDDMPRQNGQRKHGTSRGSPRPAGTAKAPRITSKAGKSRRAREWGGWGRLSVDGPGQNNPDRSEGPWGREQNSRMAVLDRAGDSVFERNQHVCRGEHERRRQTKRRDTWTPQGKAPSDKPALEPYWGKPAVRNLRGDDGNVGIIRSPVRAIVPPDNVAEPQGSTRLA